ncbi:hypothetical protein B0680_02975 [Moraxella pluranimalium]|uniref:Uncharacterized protein n=2 Tax=Moraxella pluranimalium TaxID=470453 RepID=A0A1T0CRW8_9GAMM|nr:hypothetical protein B0680_02975 [Moraxella pluranimalium]
MIDKSMSHFSTIGFDVKTSDDLLLLTENILQMAHRYSTHKKAVYFCYTDPSGAQIWVCKDKKRGDIINTIPSFLPKQTQKIGVLKIKPKGTNKKVFAHAWLNPIYYDNHSIDGDFPLVIHLPDYLNHQIKKNAQTAYLTLFANDVELYVDTHEFYKCNDKGGVKIAHESFFAIEVFDKIPHSQVLVSGTVLKSELRTNQLTNNPFYWCLIQTYASNYEAVYPFDMFYKIPEVGNIIFGKYWITGRFE